MWVYFFNLNWSKKANFDKKKKIGGPCQQIKPYFAELSRVYPHLQFLKVDVDEQQDIAYWANVRAMPTFTIYKDGMKINESFGANLNKLLEMVRVLN